MISVIVPAYNSEKYIRNCLNSILSSTYKNIEVIVVDDGSTDDTLRIAREMSGENRAIRVYHKENGGAASARNLGLLKAKGEYIGFVDSDDYILDTMYEKLIGQMDAKTDVVSCGTEEFFPNGERKSVLYNAFSEDKTIYGAKIIRELLLKNRVSFSPCDKLYRKKIVEGICFPENRTSEDIEFIYNVLKRANKLVSLGFVGYFYRYTRTSSSRKEFKYNRIDFAIFTRNIYRDVVVNYPQYKTEAIALYARHLYYVTLWIEKSKNPAKYEVLKTKIYSILIFMLPKLWDNQFIEKEIINKIEYKLWKGLVAKMLTEGNFFKYGVVFLKGLARGKIVHPKEYIKRIESLENQSEKHLRLFLMMNRWVELKQHNKSLSSYFIKHGFKRIAIYGMSYAGERLAEELEHSSVEVKYGIDKNSQNIASTIDVYGLEDRFDGIDAIIVTSVSYFDEIKSELKMRTDCPIVSLEDVIFET